MEQEQWYYGQRKMDKWDLQNTRMKTKVRLTRTSLHVIMPFSECHKIIYIWIQHAVYCSSSSAKMLHIRLIITVIGNWTKGLLILNHDRTLYLQIVSSIAARVKFIRQLLLQIEHVTYFFYMYINGKLWTQL